MVIESTLAVILHADVVGSTALVQQDERVAHDRIQDAFRRLATTVSAFGGRVREIRGDALVADFDRASDAVTGALVFQAENEPINSALAGPIRPEVRIGIALGEVVIADETVTGAGVVLAQRLEQLALPNGVTVQGAVYETVPKRLPVEFENLGDKTLKGFDEPVRAYAVTLRRDASLPKPESQRVLSPASQAPAESADLAGTSGPPVAVLPFRNLSQDPDQEYFADGLSEEIILALSACRSFPILASSATRAYKTRQIDPRAAGDELGATYVLDGSVRRAGSRLRISVELVSTDSQLQLWSERYDRSADDLFAVQDDITMNVVAIVEPEIDAQERQRVLSSQPSSMDSYELSQKGFWLLSRRTQNDYQEARALFERALEHDSRYARAYAGLSEGKYRAGQYGWEDHATALTECVELARAALDLDGRDPRALRFFGGAAGQLRQYDDGLRALRRAVAVFPSYAAAYSALGFLLSFVGEFNDAITAEATTSRLRPGDRGMYICMMSKALATYALGDYATAESVCRESLGLNEDFWLSNLMLVAALGQQGRSAETVHAKSNINRLLPTLNKSHLAEQLPFQSPAHLEHIIDGLRLAQMKLA